MSYFFTDTERKPIQAEDCTREAPEEVKMPIEPEEEEASSPLSLANSTFSASSTGSYRVTTETDEGDMTQDEVSKLVHNALRRARKATTPKTSPRASPRSSRRSRSSPKPSSPPSTKSNKSVSLKDNLKSFDSMEATYPNHNLKEDAHAATLLSSVVIKEPQKIHKSGKTCFGEKKSTDEEQSPEADAPDVGAPEGDSRNSSSDVIRRVEEEIANAKKAAEEAQNRLSYVISSRSSNSWSIDEPAPSPSTELADLLERGANHDDDLRGILSVSSGEDVEEDGEKFTEVTDTSFAIAREMISEEFGVGSHEEKESEKIDDANTEEPIENKEDESPALVDDIISSVAEVDEEEKSATQVGKEATTKENEFQMAEDADADARTSECSKTVSSGSKQGALSPVQAKISTPSQDSDFLGTIDETTLSGSRHERPVDSSGNTNTNGDDIVYDKKGEIGKHDKSRPQDLGTTSSKTEFSQEKIDETVPIEEKKEDGPLSGPWNGFISSLIGNKAAEHESSDDNEEENPAKAVVAVPSTDSQEYLTPESKDAGDGVATTVKKTTRALPVDNSVADAGNPKPRPTTPWWTSTAVPGTNPDLTEPLEGETVHKSDGPGEGVGDDNDLVSEDVKAERSTDRKNEKTDESESVEAIASKNNSKALKLAEEAPPVPLGSSTKPSPSEPPSDERKNVEDGKRDPEATLRPQLLFKEPYPTPQPLAIPRPPEDIITENQEHFPERVLRWSNPKPQLQDLLLAAKGDSLARRSNALGALKVLSLKKKNQLTLARTRGFLDAVVFAANVAFPPEDEELGLTAKARAVVTLLHVSEPKGNRNIVFGHRGLPEALVKVISNDRGEARAHACGALAMLAKTVSNRERMVQIENLVDSLSLVVKGTNRSPPITVETETEVLEEEDIDVEEHSRDGSDSSASSSDDDSAANSDDGSTGSSFSESSAKPVEPVNDEVEKNNSIKMQKESMKDEFVNCSRYNACAALLHLSKHCAISRVLCDNKIFVESMMSVSVEFDNRIHTKCLEILCNLTRFPSNNATLARNSSLVETLVTCGKSSFPQDRVWAMRAMQNIASDSSSKLILATSPILTLLSICAVRIDYDEQAAAVATLYNLSTDAGAVVPLTNTKNVVATLVHLAHDSNSSPDVRQMACDALATIGLWLQTLASAGTAPPEHANVPLPTHATAGWERWN